MLWTSKEWALFKKERPTNVTLQNRRGLQWCPCAVGIVVNKQVQGKIFAERINVHVEHIKYSKSWDDFLKHVKENYQKKKAAKEEGSWVQLTTSLLCPER